MTDAIIGRIGVLGVVHSQDTPKWNGSCVSTRSALQEISASADRVAAGLLAMCFNPGMTALPIDVALTLAVAGVDFNLPEAQLVAAIRTAIADRRGYHTEPELTDIGYRVELLSPERVGFEGRTSEMSLAWVLIYLMGEAGEIGIGGFAG